MRYAAIVEALVRHEFHVQGICTDVSIEADDETESMLRNHRCMVVPIPGGVRILTETDEGGQPLLPLAPNKRLRFCLRLRTPEFVQYTDLPSQWLRSGQPLVYANQGASGELTMAARDELVVVRGVFAFIDLRLPAARVSEPLSAKSFELKFIARRVRWVYYCLTNLRASDGPLQIVESARRRDDEALNFGAMNRTDLGAQPDPADPIARQLVLSYPALRCVRMISDQSIACRQQPRKLLELRLGDERIAGPLPLPSLRCPAREDLLYQVIKHCPQSFVNP